MSRSAALMVGILAFAAAAPGQQTILPPVRQLGPALGTVSDTFLSVRGIRQLSDARVFVDDWTGKQLLLFDSSLKHSITVIGGTSTAARSYPSQTTNGIGILPYSADSTLLLDLTAIAVVVLDPKGGIARVMSVPPAALGAIRPGRGGVDPSGRLVYEVSHRTVPYRPDPNSPLAPYPADSDAIVRMDLKSQTVDTLGFVSLPITYPSTQAKDSIGNYSIPTMNPLAAFDAWVLLPDGAVAIIRARDFHIDWITPTGHLIASNKLPHEWNRLSDSDKVALVDSIHQSFLAHPSVGTFTDARGSHVRETVPNTPPASELADYLPAFIPSGVRADADGNVWLPEATASEAGGRVYEVVNRMGLLFDRILIPGGTAIAGFGPGVVYVTSREGPGTVVVKYRIR